MTSIAEGPEIQSDPRSDQACKKRVVEIDFHDPRWLEFVSSHPDAFIFHHPKWLAAMEREYGRKCLALACVGEDEKVCGVLPLFYTRGIPIKVGRGDLTRRLSSLPRTPLCGPLADSAETAAALIQAAMERAGADVRLEIKTEMAGLAKMVPGLACIPWRETYVRGLPANTGGDAPKLTNGMPSVRTCGPCEKCDKLRFGNAREHHQVKWAVNKATKQGLSVTEAQTEEELRAWYEFYLSTMRRNVVPPRPFRFFTEIWRTLKTSGNLILLLAQLNENGKSQLVGGSILLLFGQTVFWSFTGCDEERFNLHPNDIVLWHALHESCRLGYRWFDFGEVAEEHPELKQFKAKWGTFTLPMFRYYYPAPKSNGDGDSQPGSQPSRTKAMFRKTWQRLPRPVVAQLGDLAYRFL